ncbi:TetR/AcrR family transcriptional regulator [Paenibacillus sp. N1-5-1-14]|uniref:TetR/AcrR family transcriptional regulator n=1 Tax=Paenibacillus radicibacter TaxID=2972488 RepID=UPI002158F0BB|nr:TetR/AcrR family transcriptional regulator [Paenibacillus radicibacter]MCR8645928.1 TetR/AcrR family transcriptional regulator [Paenibacillus radicibacter]
MLDKQKKQRLKFAVKGYEGTSMGDIAAEVGINKASLYTHFTGKDELFLAIYEDAAADYEKLNRTLFEESAGMPVGEQLFWIFQGYILYYHRNTEFAALWTQIVLFPPLHLRERVRVDLAGRDRFFHEGVIGLFSRAIEEGVVCRDSPARLVMSYRSMRDGLLSWMHTVPQMKEEWIRSFWLDLWSGLQRRSDDTQGG